MSLVPDDRPLARLVYVSTLSPGVTASEVRACIDQWAASNSKKGITGVLALDGDRVCQILEGPSSVVGELYGIIQADPRHHGVTELSTDPIERRHFGQWGMVRRQMVDIVTLAFSL